MGRSKLKTIEAEVGGELSAAALHEIPRADMTGRPRDRRRDDRYWRDLYGAPADRTSPEALEAHRARQIGAVPAIGAPSLEATTEVTLPAEVA